jgi:C-terminal processing protease CtpA/Prc
MKLRLLLGLTFLHTAVTHAQTQQQTDHLYTFARLYGYVRYFHPSDAVVVTDWDKLAIYGAQQVEKAGNQQELQQVLEQLFKPIAPTLQLYPTGSAPVFNTQAIPPAQTTGMKVVQWQHNGYGFGTNTQTYQSVRTNSYIKPMAPKQKSEFSTLNGFMDAQPYRGRMIRYSAATKAENLEKGTGNLWVRVDLDNNKTGFFDNMGNRPIKGRSQNWRRDTITGKIDADANQIAFGCFITDQGKMLVDDIKLEIATADGGWETIRAVNGDFEQDAVEKKPSNWFFNEEDPQFTVRVTNQQASNGKQALYLERRGPDASYQTTTTLFSTLLTAGATIKKDIGSGLSMTMPVALWGDGQHTYPLTDTAQITRLNESMTMQHSLSGSNLYVRLADIIITWNVFQHFHPYYKEWVTNWDNDLREALNACYGDKTVDDFGVTLQQLTAKMRDGHIYLSSKEATPTAFLPVKWEWIEKQLVITAALDLASPLKPGDVVTAINGKPVQEYINNSIKRVSAGTPNALMGRALFELVNGPQHDSVTLSVNSPGKSAQQVTLSFSMNGYTYYSASTPTPDYRQIDPYTIYVDLSKITWDSLQFKMPVIAQAKAVIFDLRGYPNGSNGTGIISHLLKHQENDKWLQQQQISLPDHEKTGWKGLGWSLKPVTPHINGKVFFLTNSSAISYAESVMAYVKAFKLATIIGEPTAGANGDVNWVTLPGGYTISFTGLKVTLHDGTQHFTKGILPDVTVLKSIQGIRENKDEVLAKAIALSKAAGK